MPKCKPAEQPQEPVEDTAKQRQFAQLDLATIKLKRMQETNAIAFTHRDDLGRIEDELKKFNYSPAESEYIQGPKGEKGILSFSFKEIERQNQYINCLTDNGWPVSNGVRPMGSCRILTSADSTYSPSRVIRMGF
ncbi:MAG TPA: hypothetical protein VKU02_19850 [Gemmataceae bacterium]|nr:hypothetical protein [Gemmataceae bacterium]